MKRESVEVDLPDLVESVYAILDSKTKMFGKPYTGDRKSVV